MPIMRLTSAIVTVACAATLAAQSARPAFDVVSIRPSNPDLFPAGMEAEDPCSQAVLRQTGNRLIGNYATLYSLIALAYNPWKQPAGACARATDSGLISGGPNWVKSERFAIEALFPEHRDSSSYDRLLLTGEAADVQQMLQDMLAARFNLIVRREMRDVPVYLLTIDNNLNVTRTRIALARTAGGGIPDRIAQRQGIFSSYPRGQDGTPYASVAFVKQSMLGVAQRVAAPARRLVLDRTGLEGEFDFVLEYDETGALRPTLFTALREQLGLRLRPSRAAVEVLVIERAERPSEN